MHKSRINMGRSHAFLIFRCFRPAILIVGLAVVSCGSDQEHETSPQPRTSESLLPTNQLPSMDFDHALSHLMQLESHVLRTVFSQFFSGERDAQEQNRKLLAIADAFATAGPDAISRHDQLCYALLASIERRGLADQALLFIDALASTPTPSIMKIQAVGHLVDLESDAESRLEILDRAMRDLDEYAEVRHERAPFFLEQGLLQRRTSTLVELGRTSEAIESHAAFLNFAADHSGAMAELTQNPQWMNDQRIRLARLMHADGQIDGAIDVLEQVVSSESRQSASARNRISDAHNLLIMKGIPPDAPETISVYEPLWSDTSSRGSVSWYYLAPNLAQAYIARDGNSTLAAAVWQDVIAVTEELSPLLSDRERAVAEEMSQRARRELRDLNK